MCARISFMTFKLVLGLIIVILAAITLSQDTVSDSSLSKFCNLQKNCSACIALAPKCAWCKNEVNSTRPRCDLYYNLLYNCPEKEIVSPQFNMEILVNKHLSQPGDSEENMIQITPQRIALKIRPNSPHRIEMQFRQAMDYPVDLYYLMDVSVSMRDDKVKLVNLSIALGDKMKTLTSNFQIGYGSFVDKQQMPYADMREVHKENPCAIAEQICVAAYGFKNNMGLVEDINRFVEEVNNTEISGNMDNPEGSLDALLQVIVCKNQIGWRDQSRKIVLLATDGPFHTAGDGKLAGIIRPNDGQCHLDFNGEYTESLTQDYPSLSQIIKSVNENSMNVIFAADSANLGIYNRLKEVIPGARCAELAEDSRNIVELLEKEYEEITSTVELQHAIKENSEINSVGELQHDLTDIVSVKYFTNCSQTSGEFVEQNICTGLKMGATVYFELEVQVKSCPKNRKQTLTISSVGLNEKLQIELELLCDCDCESPSEQPLNSSKCSGIGTFECGICNCPEQSLGDFCQCHINEVITQSNLTKCKKNQNQSVICSGRGECTACGICQCFYDEQNRGEIYGQYCECDDFSCPYYRGLLCGGHGKCICGECLCQSDWTGEDCNCLNNNAGCYGKSQDICNGNGICVCSECQCYSEYGGALCEIKLEVDKICQKSRPCIECAISLQFSENVTCLSEETGCNETYDIVQVDDLGKTGDDERLCLYLDEDNCRIFYIIQSNATNNSTTSIRISKDKVCVQTVQTANLSWIAAVIIGIIVLIGLIGILCWKLITTLNDRREYAQFDNQVKRIKWEADENPVYKEAITHFPNPTYNTGQNE